MAKAKYGEGGTERKRIERKRKAARRWGWRKTTKPLTKTVDKNS